MVKPEAVEGLGTFKDDLAVKHLMMIIRNRTEETRVRSKAIAALSRAGGKKVVEDLIQLIQS